MVYNTDIGTDKVYKEDVSNTIEDPIKGEIQTGNSSEYNKIMGDVATNVANNETNLNRKVKAQQPNTPDDYVKTEQKKFGDGQYSATQGLAGLGTAMDIDYNILKHGDVDTAFGLSSLGDETGYHIGEEYNQYQDFVNNVYIGDLDYDTIKDNAVLDSRLTKISNDFGNIDNETTYKILNKYGENSYKMLNLYSVLKNYTDDIDIDKLDSYYEEVKSEMDNVYRAIKNDGIFTDMAEGLRDTTNLGLLTNYLESKDINKNIIHQAAKDMITGLGIKDEKGLLGNIAYGGAAIVGNLAELVAYTALAEAGVGAVGWAAKLSRIGSLFGKAGEAAKTASKLNFMKNASIFKKISGADTLTKNQLFKYYAKQGFVFGSANMAHTTVNNILKGQHVSKGDMFEYFLEGLGYGIAGELAALKTMQNIGGVKGTIAAIGASVGVNTGIDYLVNGKVDLTSLLSNIGFGFLDVHFAYKTSNNLIKSMEVNDKIIKEGGEAIKGKIDQPTISITKEQIKDIIANCL